jgi:hypothetical protein
MFRYFNFCRNNRTSRFISTLRSFSFASPLFFGDEVNGLFVGVEFLHVGVDWVVAVVVLEVYGHLHLLPNVLHDCGVFALNYSQLLPFVVFQHLGPHLLFQLDILLCLLLQVGVLEAVLFLNQIPTNFG